MATLVLRSVKGTPLTNNEVDANFSNLDTAKLEKDGTTQMTGKLRLVTSNASFAALNIPSGAVNPTTPVSGDVWNNNGLKYFNGTTTGNIFTSLDGVPVDQVNATNIGKSVLNIATPVADRFIKLTSGGVAQVRTAEEFKNDLSISTITGFTGSAGAPGASGPTGFTGSVGFTGSGIGTSSNVQINSLGVGTPASGVAGEIRALDNITAYYTSDFRLKQNITPIVNALAKLKTINGVHFDWSSEHIETYGGEDGYFIRKHDVGVIAQQVNDVLPEAVGIRDNGYMAVRYEKLIPLLIQAIKELAQEVEILKASTK